MHDCCTVCENFYTYTFRGHDFRPDYMKCVELRSIFSKVPLLALSATVNQQILSDLQSILKLENTDFEIVSKIPDRPNIFLEVKHQSSYDFEQDLFWIVEGLKTEGENYPKTVIFAQTVSTVSDIYEFLMDSLEEDAYGSSFKNPQNRLVSMFHGQIGKELQQFTVDNFRLPDAKIRVLVSTIAFGMGVEVRDIRQIIHWGRSKSVLAYWQEIGRGGRDGQQCTAIWYPKSTAGIDKEIFDQIKADKSLCVRSKILSTFLIPGMDPSPLKCMNERSACLKDCVHCSCSLCLCCSHCKQLCACMCKK